jgi:hypothetical protein
MSGQTEGVISYRGGLDIGVSFLEKSFGTIGLARKVWAVLDKANATWPLNWCIYLSHVEDHSVHSRR